MLKAVDLALGLAKQSFFEIWFVFIGFLQVDDSFELLFVAIAFFHDLQKHLLICWAYFIAMCVLTHAFKLRLFLEHVLLIEVAQWLDMHIDIFMSLVMSLQVPLLVFSEVKVFLFELENWVECVTLQYIVPMFHITHLRYRLEHHPNGLHLYLLPLLVLLLTHLLLLKLLWYKSLGDVTTYLVNFVSMFEKLPFPLFFNLIGVIDIPINLVKLLLVEVKINHLLIFSNFKLIHQRGSLALVGIVVPLHKCIAFLKLEYRLGRLHQLLWRLAVWRLLLFRGKLTYFLLPKLDRLWLELLDTRG